MKHDNKAFIHAPVKKSSDSLGFRWYVHGRGGEKWPSSFIKWGYEEGVGGRSIEGVDGIELPISTYF